MPLGRVRFPLAIFLIGFAAIPAGCGGGGSASPVPSTANQSASAGQNVPGTTGRVLGKATLSWLPPLANTDGSALVNLTGYKIYYGMSPASLDSIATVANASVTTYVLENLTAGTWYFGVVAVNNRGVESVLSDIVSKAIG